MRVVAPAIFDLPEWLTLDFVLRVMNSKVFSAIYWGVAAIVVIIGFFARMKYRDRNLKKLLDDYVEKARKADGRERQSVKEVIRRAITEARGIAGPNSVQFRSSDVFENAARFFAQSQAAVAIDLLRRESAVCEATVNHALQQVRHARMRAATAYLEIGLMLREQGKAGDALQAFLDVLRINPEDPDALRMLGTQCRDLKRYNEAEQYFNALLYQVSSNAVHAADKMRELGLVFLGNEEYPRAEASFEEALAIEKQQRHQCGEALTHELIGLVRSRYRWPQAHRAYNLSKSMFETLNDAEGVRRVQERIDLMGAGRSEELERKEKRHAARSAGRTDGATLPPIVH